MQHSKFSIMNPTATTRASHAFSSRTIDSTDTSTVMYSLVSPSLSWESTIRASK